MPGSTATPGRLSASVITLKHIAVRSVNGVGTQDRQTIAARWLAYVLPYRRFADILANAHGSRPMWFATPSSQRTCTAYSLPVSRRTDTFTFLHVWRMMQRRKQTIGRS
jgi:hypothetical protein